MIGVDLLCRIIVFCFWVGLICLLMLVVIFFVVGILGGFLVGVVWLGVDGGLFWVNM